MITQYHVDMPETEGFARKRKVRAANQGSVTRMVGQVYESLESGEALNVPRLRQQKSLLSGELAVLLKLDDANSSEMVATDELDNEIEQADVIKEKIRLCIMDTDQALEHASNHTVIDIAATGGDSSCTTPSTNDSDSTCTHPGGAPHTSPSTKAGDDSSYFAPFY